MKKIFNTVFENSIRVLLILHTHKKPISCDMLSIIDFMTIYGKTLGIAEIDLNGYNSFAFCEYTVRRAIIKDSVKSLVLQNLISVEENKNGFCYYINKNGEMFVDSLNTKYKNDYIKLLQYSLNFIKRKKEKTLISYINNVANNGGIYE